MLSREGLHLIKSEAAALIQSLTQLELFVQGKEWRLCGSGVAGSRDGVQPVSDPQFNFRIHPLWPCFPSYALSVYIHIFICYYIYIRQSFELRKALRACTVVLKL